jgi:exodeoxyribonuclease-1
MHKARPDGVPGFLFYDYETFGTQPARDRIAQFGAILTDENLNPIAEPEIFYCQPAMDMLPHPEACLLTGITPQKAQSEGYSEWEFAHRINELMSRAETCTLGYNSFRFDDEFTRYLFYRNAIDPYAREYKNGNSRYDLIDLVRLCYALRPDGIAWPQHEDGRPSFKLEDLTQANGIEHSGAHDALADVYATIEVAKLIKQHQPKLWQWALGLRDRYQVDELLDQGKPLIHSSSRFPSAHGGTSLVLPIGAHPKIRNQHVVFNLRHSPELFLTLPLGELKDYLYTPSSDLPEGSERLPIKTIKTNRAPVLAPMATLKGVDHARIDLDLDRCLQYAEQLKACQDLKARIHALFEQAPWPASDDPDAALYEGFIDYGDRRLLGEFQLSPREQWSELENKLGDARLPEVMFRTRARSFPESLNQEEHQRWEQYRYERLYLTRGGASIQLSDYQTRIDELRQQGADTQILDELSAWPSTLRVQALEQQYGSGEAK